MGAEPIDFAVVALLLLLCLNSLKEHCKTHRRCNANALCERTLTSTNRLIEYINCLCGVCDSRMVKQTKQNGLTTECSGITFKDVNDDCFGDEIRKLLWYDCLTIFVLILWLGKHCWIAPQEWCNNRCYKQPGRTVPMHQIRRHQGSNGSLQAGNC